MSGLIFGLVVVLVIISKIRKLAGDFQSGEGADRLREVRTRLASAGAKDENFSLQQVLAEIEKVKNQSRQPAGAATRSREQVRASIESIRRERAASPREADKWRAPGRDPLETGTGPMGRSAARPLTGADEVEEGQDMEASAHLADADAAAARADQAGGAESAPAAARFNIAQLRNALVWREILGVPVSLRDE